MSVPSDYVHLRDAFIRLQKTYTRLSIVEAIISGELATWIVPAEYSRIRVPATYWKERGFKALPRKGNGERYRPSVNALYPYLFSDLQRIAEASEDVDFSKLSALSAWDRNELFPDGDGTTIGTQLNAVHYLSALNRLWKAIATKRDVMILSDDVATFRGELRKNSKGGAPIKSADDGFWLYLIEDMGSGLGIVTEESLTAALQQWRKDHKKPRAKYTDSFIRRRVSEALKALKAHNKTATTMSQ